MFGILLECKIIALVLSCSKLTIWHAEKLILQVLCFAPLIFLLNSLHIQVRLQVFPYLHSFV